MYKVLMVGVITTDYHRAALHLLDTECFRLRAELHCGQLPMRCVDRKR